MKLLRVFFRVVKGLYDILATYLLILVLPFALVGFVFHLAFGVGAELAGFTSMEQMWLAAADWSPVHTVWLRIALFLPLHIVVWRLFRTPARQIWPYIERAFDHVVQAFKSLTARLPAVRDVGELLFTLVVTALLVPFVIQPTLVPELSDERAWAERAANLLDGTAVAHVADSVVGMYRRMVADPVVVGGVSEEEVEEVLEQTIVEDGPEPPSDPIVGPLPTGSQPLMDRWDPFIERTADGDAEKFAYIKAFMWVESAGRQYAVSRTGCSGLMQFCAGTARSQPYKRVFGTGQIYVCSCRDGACSIPSNVQKDLESGDPSAIERHRPDFPCEMTDARFDPDKAIRAGGLYVDSLRSAFGGNIYLMYVGYNSGPAVARAVWNKVGQNPRATLEEIEVHLGDAMVPHYGERGRARARSLVDRHLPKIERAYRRYREPRPTPPVVGSPTPPGQSKMGVTR